MYRVLVCGAGRIGAAFQWPDREYTHAGAILANSDRAVLVGFVEPNRERATEARLTWDAPTFNSVHAGLEATKPDIVCVATQPDQQKEVLSACEGKVKAVYCEKPYKGEKYSFPVQVNYIRRADAVHRMFADKESRGRILQVAGKNEYESTRCHFEDLAKWWNAQLVYQPYNGPNSYILWDDGSTPHIFRNGGVNGGECMASMLRNLIDHLELGTPLFSPAY